jgi:RHS repeat-associated protein
VNNRNQLTSVSGSPNTTFTYDNNGNTATKVDGTGTTTYTWNSLNQLKQVTLPGGATVTFKYDPFGRRVQKVSASGTINYVYDGANAIEELDSVGAVLAKYAQGEAIDEPVALLRGGISSFYHGDALGTVTSLTNGTAAIANTYTYNAFGKLSAFSETVTNPIRYTSREFDTETGLYFYRARYYDLPIGRFLSEDPIHFAGDGPNFYAYVKNSPVNWLDPLGLFIKPSRWPNAKTRNCNSDEYAECAQQCGSKGVESCKVSQVFRVVRWRGVTLRKWVDGPMSCSCNEDKNCRNRIPIITPFAHWINEQLGYPFSGPFWDRVREAQRDFERGPQPPPGPIPGPMPVPLPLPVPVIP